MTKDAATTHQPQPLLTGFPLLAVNAGLGDICANTIATAELVTTYKQTITRRFLNVLVVSAENM